MQDGQKSLFRQKSLERLASPEQLDQLMQVVSVRAWVPLATLGLMVAGALAWSVFGRVPVIVQGRGALVDPQVALGAEAAVVDVTAPGSGTLMRLEVRRGEKVRQGQVLGVVDQPELSQQLDLERERLEELMAEQRSLDPLRRQKVMLSKRSLEAQRLQVRDSLKNVEALTPVLRSRAEAVVRGERRTLQLRLTNAEAMLGSAKATFETRRELRAKGLIPSSSFQAAESDYLRATEQVSSLRGQLESLAARETDNKKAYLANLAEIDTLKSRLRELDAQGQAGELDALSSNVSRQSELDQSRSRVAALEKQLQDQGQIVARSDGRIVEITAVVGQPVNRGSRLASIDLAHDDGDGPALHLGSVAYFTIGDGMRIKPGMAVQITPDTIKREEFGGILGQVAQVSEFPVSTESAVNVTNSPDIARAITAGEHNMEVFATLELNPETTSGYRWSSSKGPDLKMALGTTCAVRVTIEERAPITFLLPILKSAMGS